ncbi:MAG: YdeI/OmpD-associated family protein [Actinobacteria bacterium]|nr:YdeI/OmpD-associated family protein [Actinomycetota bacterium]
MVDRRDDAPQLHVETTQQWREWLAENHTGQQGVWLVSWKRATGRPTVPYVEAVEEALTVGWIDATVRTLDDERTAQWFTRRKPGSGWALTNKARVARLEVEKRMLPAGTAAVEAAKADGSWALFDEADALIVPADLAAAFDGHPGAEATWDAYPKSVKRLHLVWLVQAKRPETRANRVEQVAAKAAAGERAIR